MKFGILIETNEAEKAWNGVRFANASIKAGHEVRIFLMSAGVEIESITHETFNVQAQLNAFHEAGGTVGCCGTCKRGRELPATEVCPIASMADLIEMVVWADKTLTF